MFRFIHTADIHLDSPLTGLELYEGAPVEEIRQATRRAFENLVQFAVDQKVHFILIAGDLYDGDWRDFNTGLFFVKQMVKLRDANIRVYIVSGNHDAASTITQKIPLPANVTIFPTQKPQTIVIEKLSVAIHGQGFIKPAVYDNLSKGYPDPVQGYFNIGLLHTCAEGAEGHERYAPCSVEELQNKGYDYWALGHVHSRKLLSEDPYILFPGNIQGRHIKECGEKGCTLVTVEDRKVESTKHINLDIMRWSFCNIDLTNAESEEQILQLVDGTVEDELMKSEGRSVAIRLRLSGSCILNGSISKNSDDWKNNIRARVHSISSGKVWVEKIIFKTTSKISLEEIISRGDPIGELIDSIKRIDSNADLLSELENDFSDLKKYLPLQIQQELFNLEDPNKMKDILDDVIQLLISKLLRNS